jgi:hypothetical protein
MECSVYGKGVQLTLLRRRLETEELTAEQRREIEEAVQELERDLDIK